MRLIVFANTVVFKKSSELEVYRLARCALSNSDQILPFSIALLWFP